MCNVVSATECEVCVDMRGLADDANYNSGLHMKSTLPSSLPKSRYWGGGMKNFNQYVNIFGFVGCILFAVRVLYARWGSQIGRTSLFRVNTLVMSQMQGVQVSRNPHTTRQPSGGPPKRLLMRLTLSQNLMTYAPKNRGRRVTCLRAPLTANVLS